MLSTTFTRLVGCDAPIQLAGMGGVAAAPLVAAVANGGGLGMLGAVLIPPHVLRPLLDSLRGMTAGKIGANFLMPFLDEECVRIAGEKCDVVDFFYDGPRADLVKLVHDGGAMAAWQVGSVEEARAAIDAGCDFIIAQGVEAGGHVRGNLALLVLLDQILSFAEVPVLAAGGVSSARGLAAVLAGGAAGIRVGTRFLVADESSAHPRYIEALIAGRGEDTVLTEAFSEMWPDSPHRVFQSAVDAANARTGGPVAEMVMGGDRQPIPRFHVAPPDITAEGDIDAMALYAGHSVSAVTRRQPAAEIIRELVEGAESLLSSVQP